MTLIDADAHVSVPSVHALLDHLPAYWRARVLETDFKGPMNDPYPPSAPYSRREDLRELDDTELVARLRDGSYAAGVTETVISCAYAVDSIRNPDGAAVMATAVNRWLADEVLAGAANLRGSIVVPNQVPVVAAGEIDRVGSDDAFAQVVLPARSPAPYGNRNFDPIFAAAARNGLPVAIQYGGFPGLPPTGVGWPTYEAEDYAGMQHVVQSQLLSLVVEGVFQRHPDLRVVLTDCGFAWLPAFMWRLDKDWKGLRRETPWVTDFPSDIIRRHVYLTVQPLDLPSADPELLADLLEQIGGADRLLFATDFPHRHEGPPPSELLAGLPDDSRSAVAHGNAAALYRIGVRN